MVNVPGHRAAPNGGRGPADRSEEPSGLAGPS